MTILICGASGLVGRELCKLLEKRNIDFIGTYNSNKIDKPNMFKIDFSDSKQIEDLFINNNITSCIFCIVERLTDICEKDWDKIKQTNIDLVHITSFISNKLNVKFIHLSTDYVFDGSIQPNYPDSLKNPLQNYGISKLISEYRVSSNCKDYCIIRTPVLYSALSKLHDNAVCLIGKNAMDLRKGKIYKEDNYSIRRPLYIEDLCKFVLECNNNNYIGIYHFFNPYNKYTKYEISQIIRKHLQIDNENIIPNNEKSSISSAPRPYDTQLIDDKVCINNYSFIEFEESIRNCFEKFKHPKISIENKNDFFFMIDLDGTVIDSNLAHYTAYSKVFEKRAISFLSFTEWNDLILTDNIDNYFKKIFKEEEECKIIKDEKISELEGQTITFTKNSDVFLRFLINNNVNFCIVTNTSKKTVDLFKRKLPLLNEINQWIYRDDCQYPKPDPQPYSIAIDRFYKNEKYKIGIEDSNVGLEALRNITNIIYIFKNGSLFLNNDCYLFDDYNSMFDDYYYSPILFSKIADLNITQFHNCNVNIDEINSKEKIIIYCLNSSMYLIRLNYYLDHIKKPFILITAMDDTTFPHEIDNNLFNKISEHQYFKHWFAINKVIENNDKYTTIPYGLDFWTLTVRSWFGEVIQDFYTQNLNLNNIAIKAPIFSKKISKIYGNFHLNITDTRHGGWRSKLKQIIPSEIIYFENKQLSRTKSWENMSKYAFVLSPFGNGFDCIRTYEALCLGCIPIIKDNPLNSIYYDLPVLIVNNWEDINESLLNSTLIEFENKKFNYDKLKMQYWINLIYSKF